MTDSPGLMSRSSEAPAPRTLLDILRATTASAPDASAIEDDRGALSYRELMAQVNVLAARLHAAGVRRGDRVGVRMPSGTRELYLSILGVIAGLKVRDEHGDPADAGGLDPRLQHALAHERVGRAAAEERAQARPVRRAHAPGEGRSCTSTLRRSSKWTLILPGPAVPCTTPVPSVGCWMRSPAT